MAKENLLYFNRDNNERAAFPAKNFLGCDLSDADTIQISFKDLDGSATPSIVSLNIKSAAHVKEACEVLTSVLAKNNGRLTVVADEEAEEYLYPFTAINSIS